MLIIKEILKYSSALEADQDLAQIERGLGASSAANTCLQKKVWKYHH